MGGCVQCAHPHKGGGAHTHWFQRVAGCVQAQDTIGIPVRTVCNMRATQSVLHGGIYYVHYYCTHSESLGAVRDPLEGCNPPLVMAVKIPLLAVKMPLLWHKIPPVS